MSSLCLAIDIGGTNTKFALLNKDGDIVEKYRIPTKSNSFDELVLNIKNSLGLNINNVSSIGIGAPNVSSDKLKIENAGNLFFENANVIDIFKKEFNLTPVLENDANTAAIGEKLLGCAQEFSNFIVLTIGTGIGSGLYIENKLFQGSLNTGSEFGHSVFIPKGRKCSCGLLGHVEAYISCPGICKTYKELNNVKINFTDLAQSFLKGEKISLKTIDVVAEQFAFAAANLSCTLPLEAIIFTGGGSILGTRFLSSVESYYNKLEYSNLKGSTKLLLSNFDPEYGAIMGAYALTKI